MRPKWKRSPTRWKRPAGAARTRRKCWGSVTRRCYTRCGNSNWISRGRGKQLPQHQYKILHRLWRRGAISATSNSGYGFRERRQKASVSAAWRGGWGMTERRMSRRYDLSLPIIIRLPTERTLDSQQGTTRDISTRGLYFVVDQNLESGSQVDITLTLPAEITHGSEVFVRALGKVVRVERRMEDGSARMGIAAVIERYDIIRGEAARA